MQNRSSSPTASPRTSSPSCRRSRSLFVIARNSSFTYKGKPVAIRDVGRELGVRYVLEGSVRNARNRVRVTAQLIEATTGGHVWAERYDRELADIFAVQDEITNSVSAAIQPALERSERERVGAQAGRQPGCLGKLPPRDVAFLQGRGDGEREGPQLLPAFDRARSPVRAGGRRPGAHLSERDHAVPPASPRRSICRLRSSIRCAR